MTGTEIVSTSLPAPLRSPSLSPAAVYLARLAPGSRRSQGQALATIADIAHPGSDAGTFPWHGLDYQHSQTIRARLAESYKPATCNKMLSALRGCLKEAWRLGLMDAEQYQRAADVAPVRGTTLPKGRALAGDELSALVAVCEVGSSPIGIRDAALFCVLYSAGVRRSEVVALQVPDYRRLDASLTVRHGKNNKARITYLADFAIERLERWLKLRPRPDGPIFLRIHRSGAIAESGLTDQAVRQILLRRAAEAGIAACSPHDFRRTMISDLLDSGVDISTAQGLAGHANVATTQRYDRRGEATKRSAAQKLRLEL